MCGCAILVVNVLRFSLNPPALLSAFSGLECWTGDCWNGVLEWSEALECACAQCACDHFEVLSMVVDL